MSPSASGGPARRAPRAMTPARRAATFTRVASLLGIGGGCVVLLGWAFDIRFLKQPLPIVASMKPNTAVAFVLAGLSLRSLIAGRFAATLGLGSCVTLLGLLTVSQYVFGWDLGIDELLARDSLAVATSSPGRMAPLSAVGFVALGLALAGATNRARPWLAQPPALVAVFLAAIAITGYLYNIRALYGVGPFTAMAVHTAALLCVVSLGVLFVHPNTGVMAPIMSDHVEGTMARRMMSAGIVIPLALGWIRLEGQRAGFYDTEFGLALMVVGSMVVLSVVTWLNARSLGKADAGRRQAEAVVRQVNESLERRVAEQTLELRSSLADKELLLMEIHHRVKNNLQVVSSLLNLQADSAPDPRLRASLADSQSRVRAMALLHEALYQSDNLAGVDFAAFAGRLWTYLAHTFGTAGKGIRFDARVDAPPLDIEQAVPCALIATELLSNALKHAFAASSGGTVAFDLCPLPDNPGHLRLRIADDGAGVTDEGRAKAAGRGAIGLKIIEALGRQLGATQVWSGPGTTFTMTFAVSGTGGTAGTPS